MAIRSLLGEGCVRIAKLGSTGQGVDFKEWGVGKLGITVNQEFAILRDFCKKGSPQVAKVPIKSDVTVSLNSQDFSKEALERYLFGYAAEITTSTLTEQEWDAPDGTAFVEGADYLLPNGYKDVGTITFKDNAATPVAITNTKYVLTKRWGRVRFTDLDGYTVDKLHISGAVNQPSASALLIEKTGIATGNFDSFALQYEGRYSLDGVDKYGALYLAKVQVEPGSEFNLLSPDDFASVDLTGTALANTDLPTDDFFGNTGYFVWLNEGA